MTSTLFQRQNRHFSINYSFIIFPKGRVIGVVVVVVVLIPHRFDHQYCV